MINLKSMGFLIFLSTTLMALSSSQKGDEVLKSALSNYWNAPSVQTQVQKSVYLDFLEETRKTKGDLFFSQGSVYLKTKNKTRDLELLIMKGPYLFIGKKKGESKTWKISRFKRNKHTKHFLNFLFQKSSLKEGFKILSFKKNKSTYLLHIQARNKGLKSVKLEIRQKKPIYITKIFWKDDLGNTTQFSFSKFKTHKKSQKNDLFTLPKNSVVTSL